MGDGKQLEPVVTGRAGLIQVNEFRDRLINALPTSLIRESFPTKFLTEQSRSHPSLVAFSNLEFYGNSVKTAEALDRPLDPALKAATNRFLGPSPTKAIEDNIEILRTAMLVVEGPVCKARLPSLVQ